MIWAPNRSAGPGSSGPQIRPIMRLKPSVPPRVSISSAGLRPSISVGFRFARAVYLRGQPGDP